MTNIDSMLLTSQEGRNVVELTFRSCQQIHLYLKSYKHLLYTIYKWIHSRHMCRATKFLKISPKLFSLNDLWASLDLLMRQVILAMAAASSLGLPAYKGGRGTQSWAYLCVNTYKMKVCFVWLKLNYFKMFFKVCITFCFRTPLVSLSIGFKSHYNKNDALPNHRQLHVFFVHCNNH